MDTQEGSRPCTHAQTAQSLLMHGRGGNNRMPACCGEQAPGRTCTSTQYLLEGFWSKTSLVSAISEGLDMGHL